MRSATQDGITHQMTIQPTRHRQPQGLTSDHAIAAYFGCPAHATTGGPGGPAAALPRGPKAVPDLLPGLLAEDARRGRHEGLWGGLLAAGFMGALFMGWAIPVLTAAFVAAPFIALAIEWQDRRAA